MAEKIFFFVFCAFLRRFSPYRDLGEVLVDCIAGKEKFNLSVFNHVSPNFVFVHKFVEEIFEQIVLFGNAIFGVVKFA